MGLGVESSLFGSKALSRTVECPPSVGTILLTWQWGELYGRGAGDLAGVQLHTVVVKAGLSDAFMVLNPSPDLPGESSVIQGGSLLGQAGLRLTQAGRGMAVAGRGQRVDSGVGK